MPRPLNQARAPRSHLREGWPATRPATQPANRPAAGTSFALPARWAGLAWVARTAWRAVLAVVPLIGLMGMGAPALGAGEPAAASAPVPAASAPPTHRPLRSNQPAVVLPPTEPENFNGYPGQPAYSVLPRQHLLTLYPCSQCHKVMPVNPTPRQLVAAPHPAALQHGKGQMWCLNCHMPNDRDVLHGVRGNRIGFNESNQVCAQCHTARHRDWVFGAHGKRVSGWTGDRQLYACTHCHDPHNPALAPRAPSKPPPVRAGLVPMQQVLHELPKLWQLMNQGTPGHEAPRKP